jgi:hypothetical protein
VGGVGERKRLDSFQWRIGSSWWDPHLLQSKRDDAVLLYRDHHRVTACGLGDDFPIWEAFFRLAAHQPTGWRPTPLAWLRILVVLSLAGLLGGAACVAALPLAEALGAFGTIRLVDYGAAAACGGLFAALYTGALALAPIVALKPRPCEPALVWGWYLAVPPVVSIVVWMVLLNLTDPLFLLPLMTLLYVALLPPFLLIRIWEHHWEQPRNGPFDLAGRGLGHDPRRERMTDD